MLSEVLGYDWDKLRHRFRETDIRPVIKHREFYPLDNVHNVRHEEDTYHRRSSVGAWYVAGQNVV